jgi:hypothetical protein
VGSAKRDVPPLRDGGFRYPRVGSHWAGEPLAHHVWEHLNGMLSAPDSTDMGREVSNRIAIVRLLF